MSTVERIAVGGSVAWSQTYLYEDTSQPYALTGISDALGVRQTRYSYNKFAQVTSTGKADGSETYAISYPAPSVGATALAREVNTPLGKIARYTFGADPINTTLSLNGLRFSGVTEVGSAYSTGRSSASSFNGPTSVALISSQLDFRGTRTNFSYDAARRPSSVTYAVGTSAQRTEVTQWHPSLDKPAREIRPGLITDYEYDAIGRLTRQVDSDTTTQTTPYATSGQQRVWTFTWTALGKLATINGPNGPDANGRDDITSFIYDTKSNLVAETNALGHTTGYSGYDANGRPGRLTEANGLATDFTYDTLGRLLTRTVRHPTDASGDAITSFVYDLEGRLKSIRSPTTEALFFEYSPIGRLSVVQDSVGARVEFKYDALGNRIEDKTRTAADVRRTISRTFDDLGRMLTETLGPGRTRTFVYDANDNVQVTKDARNHATQFAFDALDRAIGEVDPLSNNASNSYDGQDNAVTHTDKINVTTTYVRDGFGQIIQEVSPDRGISVYRYDPAGDLVSSIDGRFQTMNYVRDALGRMTSKQAIGENGHDVAYTYDTSRIGRLATIADASGTTAYAYDHRGNVTGKALTISGAFSASVGYAYDLADRIVQITYPSGRSVDYTRDALGRVATVNTKADIVAAPAQLASAMAYEPFGPLASLTYGNGLILTQDWGSDQRLYGKAVKTAADDARWSKTYLYDADDNITAINDAGSSSKSMQFTYDGLSRLTKATGYVGTVEREDYNYDANGNRLTLERRLLSTDVDPTDVMTSTITPGTNRLAQVAGTGTVRKLEYDGRGNIVGELRNASLVTTSYDPYGRLTSYGFFGVPSFSMRYSGTDERVEVTVGSTPRRFVYDEDGRLIGEYGTGSADIKAEHVWLMPSVDEGGWEPLALIGPTTTSWVTGDHLGKPVLLTKADTTQANLFDGTPFGLRWKQYAASPTTAMAFPGQIMDIADRFYNKYRDYDPSLGRYLQADPIGLGGGDNLYGYVGGNPVGWVDSEGLQRGSRRGTSGSSSRSDPLAAAEAAAQYARSQAAGVPGGSFISAPGSGPNSQTAAYLRRTNDEQIAAKEALSSCPTPRRGIYEFPDQLAGGVSYVGSGIVAQRLARHRAAGRLIPGTEQFTPIPGNRTALEVAEHNRIQQLTGGQAARTSPNVSNQRDPVGPNRRAVLGLPDPYK